MNPSPNSSRMSHCGKKRLTESSQNYPSFNSCSLSPVCEKRRSLRLKQRANDPPTCMSSTSRDVSVINRGKQAKFDDQTNNYSSSRLRSFEGMFHTGERPFDQESIDGTSSSAVSDNKTRPTENAKKVFQCSYCPSVFSHGSNLIKHERIHTGEKPYKCGYCGSAYSDISNFKYHMRHHTGDKSDHCTLCDMSFYRKSELKIHMRMHTGEKPYRCVQCDDAFPTISSMKKHMICHSDEKNFKCLYCGISYKRESYLKVHVRSHTGERPYKCGCCGAAFNMRHALRSHMMLHTGERPHKCCLCKAAFIQKHRMDVHMLAHNEALFVCGCCGLYCSSQNHLTRHERYQHGKFN